MSSFYCEKCRIDFTDIPEGYIIKCEHYPMSYANFTLIDLDKSRVIQQQVSVKEGLDMISKMFGLPKRDK